MKLRRMSMSTRVIFVMGLLIILIGSLFAGYITISNLISELSSGEIKDLESSLEVVEGLLLVLIFLTISFVLYLGKTLFDIYTTSRENQFSVEISKMTSKIDQQTTLEKLDFCNDRMVKLVGNFANVSRNNLKIVYSALFQTYMLKSMKTEKDFEKIKSYTNVLLKAYAESYNMREIYTDKRIGKICEAAVMYDIGKLGTPGYILYKEGNLHIEDFEIAKRHANVGYDLVASISPEMRKGSFEQYLQDIAGYHHERYDGTGYPRGTKGEEIPFIARVIALITTYDTITRDRPYSKAMSHDEAVLLINNEKSHYFDPKIVKIFNGIEKEFRKIKEKDLK
jgi:HD-GYP domain-containing protein (c-di-GMP phosphodiesterase class II)